MSSLLTPGPLARTSSPPTLTPTTDFALIESQKENIRPLASGRSAATLSTLFEKDTVAEKAIQDGHERFHREIEEAERRDREGEDMIDGTQDVLDIYNQYVLFTTQHHPASAAHLLPLLESTTRRFVPDARYAQDARYLKLWVLYTRHVERREEVWAFLESRDIGTRHAVFYEEWATATEGLGRKKKADEIYRLGIARKAAPVERLKTRHQAFLARIMAPPSGIVPDDEPQPSRQPNRAVLGSVTSTPSSVSGASQLAPSSRLSKSTNGAKMEIFSDQGGRAEESAPGEWAEFGTVDGKRKENTVEATPWKGETLPQHAVRARVAPRTPKVEVFKDTSDNDAIRPAEDIFSRTKQPLTEAELLKGDPLRHYDTSTVSNSVPVIPSLPAPPSARKPRHAKSSSRLPLGQPWECPIDGPLVKDAKGKTEKRMFDWDNVYKGGEEWTFEEVRARQRGLLGKDWRGEVKDWEKAWHMPGSSTPKQEVRKSVPSPTVNTKLANEEVLRMFDQTIHGGKARDSDSESEDDSGSDEDGDVALDIAPTPLPSRPAAMLAPATGLVPPTPTPAQGHVAQNRLLDENVFGDENVMPPSASKPAKINIFSETPSKTPLASRTPLATSSSSKPRAFGIFSEETPAQETPSAASRRPLGQVNAFATPAVSEKAPRRDLMRQTITEEAEEEGEDDEQVLQRVIEEHYVNINDEPDDDDQGAPRRLGRFTGIHEMTPITERTCEFTQMTNMRSSLGGNTFSSHRSSIREDDEYADNGLVLSNPPELATGLSRVSEEGRSNKSSTSPRSTFFPDMERDSPAYNRSGSVDSDFKLPEGFTIHERTNHAMLEMNTMVIVDEAETMYTARNGSAELEHMAETEEFVTASQPEASGSTLPNPCNPSDDDVIATLLAIIDPPLASLPGFNDLRSTPFARLDTLQKHAKSKVRRGSTNSRSSIAPDESIMLDLPGRKYEIKDKIGEGGFGAVFLGVDVQAQQILDDADSDDEEEDGEDKCLVAIKVEKPASVWEAVVLDRIHRQLDEDLRRSIVQARSLHAFADESYLLLDYSPQGTLLDIVNKASQMGIAPAVAGAPSAVDELVAIFFTVELLKLVEGLHNANFIHGDLKIDNCLVRLDDTPSSETWSAQYDPSGGNGWSHKGVRLIDFGRAIDVTLYPAGEQQTFIADWKTDERDCVEMREARPWSYQTDYFGLASVCYCLLFGKYISTEIGAVAPGQTGTRYKIATPLKRYWQTELWNKLFDMLLNPKMVRPDGEMPITSDLTGVRREFEIWLGENCQKGGKSLKPMLKKIELAAMAGRRG